MSKRSSIMTSVKNLRRGSKTFRERTKEVHRWDRESISKRMNTHQDTIAECQNFLNRIFQNPQQISLSKHLKKRLKQYVGAMSRTGDYIEMYPEEYDFIMDKNETFPQYWFDTHLVEIGFNKFGHVCKVASVTVLPTERYLFTCFGVDGGIKTAYVTPEYKKRASYNSKDKRIVYH